MNITGVITEYNPFHNGHRYHLAESRRLTGAGYVIAVMSGDFLQRGVPAIINKYERTRMALLGGADLVLELPAAYACSSAEHFALGGISLLHALGDVTDFVFGSECADLSLLSSAASLLAEEPRCFQEALNQELKKGLSFPLARQAALSEILSEEAARLLSHPNNILGLEYLKALRRLKSPIVPHCLERLGSGYHDKDFTENAFASASGIRHALLFEEKPDRIEEYVPDFVLSILKTKEGTAFPMTEGDFSVLLHYKLLLSQGTYDSYADISPDLARRMERMLPQYTGMEEFIRLLKTKNYTWTRISRCLMHLLLEIKEGDFLAAQQSSLPVPYARVLGFRKSASDLLGILNRSSRIPLLTKMADAEQTLEQFYKGVPALQKHASFLLERDIFAAEVYEAAAAQKFSVPPVNEYTHGIVILP